MALAREARLAAGREGRGRWAGWQVGLSSKERHARGWCGRWGLAGPDAVWLVSRGNGPCGEGGEAGLRGVREDRAQEREGAREQARLGRALREGKWAERGLLGPGSWVGLGWSLGRDGLGFGLLLLFYFLSFANSNHSN